MRTFQYSDAKSHKFWNIEVSGNSITMTFGEIGAAGQTQAENFFTDALAEDGADKLIRKKLAEGYCETTPRTPDSTAEAFERALIANPRDLATMSMYADYLMEQGDPRGEFMQVQIALEDESRSTMERKQLQVREQELLAKHERDWLSNLPRHLLDRTPNRPYRDNPDLPAVPATEHRWRRGFLAELMVECLTVRLAQALADSAATRFLQRLHIVSTAYYLSMRDDTTPRRVPGPPEYRGYDEWLELLGAPLLRCLRVFQMGDDDGEPPEEGWMDNHTNAPGIERLIAEMTHIEELHLLCKHYDRAALFALPNLTNLRVLRMYALGDPVWSREHDIELDILAQNPVLGNLTHLMVHPHFADESVIPLRRVAPLLRSPHLKSLIHLQLRLSDMGDAGVREMLSSGILKRLKCLDLRHGCITDEGAKLFAACADARNLERLDLSRNAVSSDGLRVLREAGVNAVANNPLTEQELADREYLREGDFE
jgi:uncharacterized protein (TIGR02996 family)